MSGDILGISDDRRPEVCHIRRPTAATAQGIEVRRRNAASLGQRRFRRVMAPRASIWAAAAKARKSRPSIRARRQTLGNLGARRGARGTLRVRGCPAPAELPPCRPGRHGGGSAFHTRRRRRASAAPALRLRFVRSRLRSIPARTHRRRGVRAPRWSETSTGPMTDDMPNSQIIRRASPVARSRSFAAPVENFPERDLFGRASAEQHGQAIHQLVFLKQIAIFRRLLHVTERRESARNDRHLVNRLRAGRELGDDGVARLVKRDDSALFHVHRAGSSARDRRRRDRWRRAAPAYRLRAFRRAPPAAPLRSARSRDRRPPFPACGVRHIRGRRRRPASPSGMHLQDGMTAGAVGTIDQHLSIEASRPQQRRVENLGAVGRGEDDDAVAGVEAVHFHQELIQRLLALVACRRRRGRSSGSCRWRPARR